jgi:two-component system response regulator VicR
VDVPKVLIVDDEPEVARALRRILTRRGFEVEVAPSGEAGLARLEPFAPDIVISDHRMPKMKGPEFLAAVSLRAPSAALFLISGQMDLEAPTGAPDPVGHHLLAKPWNNDDLVAALQAALEARRVA